jgi:CheY-like chemotaxis protein
MTKIMIVDDSGFQRRVLKSALVELGYEVKDHLCGADVVEALKTKTVDLLISDLLMPEMSGIQLIEALRKAEFAEPIIVLSANIQPEVKKESLAAGANAFLNKPFDVELLKTELETCLKAKKAG